MFVFLTSFLAYLISFGWLLSKPTLLWVGFGLGAVVTLIQCIWYLPKRTRTWVIYGLPTVLFVAGGGSFLLLVDQVFSWAFAVLFSLCLSVWWRNVYHYFHEKQHYQILTIPQTARWFLPIGFFLAMNGLQGLAVFFGMSAVGLMLYSLGVWVISLVSTAWFSRLEWNGIRVAFLILTVCFLELGFVVFLLPNTFYVKASIETLFFILANLFVKSSLDQSKASRTFVQLSVASIVFLMLILATARWK